MQQYLQAFDTLLKLGSDPDASQVESESPNLERSTKPAISNLVDELLRVHEHERQRLGQELHDTAGQMVVALQFSIANLKRVHDDDDRERLFDEIQDTVLRIDQELRSLAFLRYPAELGDRSLGAAIQALVSGFGRRTGIATGFDSVGDTSADQSVSVALLRIVQEALVNVRRHSHATEARVVLERRDGDLRLTISDNGVGMPSLDRVRHAQGIGLQGMRYRVETLGGHLSIRNLKPGLRIIASVPVGRCRKGR